MRGKNVFFGFGKWLLTFSENSSRERLETVAPFILSFVGDIYLFYTVLNKNYTLLVKIPLQLNFGCFDENYLLIFQLD